MNPKLRIAGLAGILTGITLAGEFIFFMVSGFTQNVSNDPASAVAFLSNSSSFLRIAVLFGGAGVVFRTVYVAGLAAKLHSATPTRAVATLYFGLLGGVGHGLVALSFYVGIPMIVTLATQDLAAAISAWGAFNVITSGFEGFGNFLLGLVLLVAGWAIISRKALSGWIGWVGVLAGIATLVRVFVIGTSFAALAYAAFLPSFVLAAVFDILAGIGLWRIKE